MKIIQLIVILLLLMGCKTKTSVKNKHSATEANKTELSKQEQIFSEKQSENKQVEKSIVSDHEKKSETEFEIKGEAKTDQPFVVHEVQNGDTLQSISVVGNAEIYYKNKRSESNIEKKETFSSSLESTLKEFTKSLINEKKLSEKKQEIKEAKKEIITKTGTFWSFGLIAILGVVALVLVSLFIYFKLIEGNAKY